MNNYTFNYHVNDSLDKNDFAKWIWEVLDDEELAARLHKIYDKDKYIDIIEQRIKELEST